MFHYLSSVDENKSHRKPLVVPVVPVVPVVHERDNETERDNERNRAGQRRKQHNNQLVVRACVAQPTNQLTDETAQKFRSKTENISNNNNNNNNNKTVLSVSETYTMRLERESSNGPFGNRSSYRIKFSVESISMDTRRK